MTAKRFSLALLMFVLMMLPISAVFADVDPLPDPPDWSTEGLRIDYQRVNVTIDNQIATTHIDQLFVNESDRLMEGTFLYPLPEGAAVSELTMWINGEPIESKILPKEEARAIYDEIVRSLRDPALLEYVDRNVIQANVFPIPPGEERRIEIEYTSLLSAESGLVHYTFPQAVGVASNLPLGEQAIRVEIDSAEPLRAIYSPTHPVDVAREGEFAAVAGYEAQNVVANQDFELYYTISAEAVGAHLLSYREPGSDGYFMLLAAPAAATEDVVAKDVIMVVDTSGSMESVKMDPAKLATKYVVDHLNPDDRFNLIAFGTSTRRFSDELLPVDGLAAAEVFIDNLAALGGTNISTALLEAAQSVDPTRPTTILFVTDGNATEGITERADLISAVADDLPPNARIFAFGVGNDVDPDLLDGLAQLYRGTTEYVREGETIDEEIGNFYQKISAPVLSDISLEIDGALVDQLYPVALPDLFIGSQLVVTGRYRAGGPVTVRLSGSVNGEPRTFTFDDQMLHDSGGDEFIPHLWATRAVGHMLREMRLNGENEELVQSVMALSTRYGIITPYTSFLIEEEDIWQQLGRDPQPVPEFEGEAGWSGVEEAAQEESVAIDMAEDVADLADADSVASSVNVQTTAESEGVAAVPAENSVRVVDAKTFVLRSGVWIDTSYDASRHTLRPVAFASDAYFDLISAEPELARYFALGNELVVVVDEMAFLVGESVETSEAALSAVDTMGVKDAVSAEATPAPAEPDSPTKPRTQPGLCGALFAYPILLGFGSVAWWVGRRW